MKYVRILLSLILAITTLASVQLPAIAQTQSSGYLAVSTSEVLSNVTVTPETMTTATETDVTISFTTPVLWPKDGKIVIIFPIQYSLNKIAGVSSGDISGGLEFEVVNFRQVHITRSGGTDTPADTTIDDLEIFKVTTPATEDLVDTYKVYIEDANEKLLAQGTAPGHEFTETFYTDEPTAITLHYPNGGETLIGDEQTAISWIATGYTPYFKLEVSTDGGKTFELIDTMIKETSHGWAVPNVDTDSLKIKVTALDENGTPSVWDISDSNVDVIHTQETVVIDDGETSTSVEIPHYSLIKGQSTPSVYFLAPDAKRYIFPSEQIFYKWFDDFKDVIEVSDEVLASFKLGTRIKLPPGTLMKIQSDPKVYVVDQEGNKRHIASEEVAKELFGFQWNENIIDIDVTQYLDYPTGDQITLDNLDFITTIPQFPIM